MSNKDILEKAIQKAIHGGWRGDMLNIIVQEQSDGLVRVYWDDSEWSVLDIIYNHKFAQALWPDDDNNNSYWKMHLSRMVVADNPLAYLADHI